MRTLRVNESLNSIWYVQESGWYRGFIRPFLISVKKGLFYVIKSLFVFYNIKIVR